MGSHAPSTLGPRGVGEWPGDRPGSGDAGLGGEHFEVYRGRGVGYKIGKGVKDTLRGRVGASPRF